MTKQGLDLTYATLATSRNEAAIDVLAEGLTGGDRAIRRRCLDALITRGERRSAEAILQRWDHLSDEDLRDLVPRRRKLAAAIGRTLDGEPGDTHHAITATVALGLNSLIPSLVELAESDPVDAIRSEATRAILDLVRPLGHEARCHYDRPSERGPALARLTASVSGYAAHRNEQLLDAFLSLSTWSDRDLAGLLAPESHHTEDLMERFATSGHRAVIELATGFLRRRAIPQRIQHVLRERQDPVFCECLLTEIGPQPGEAVLRNLAALGIPACCRGGETLLDRLSSKHHAALASFYVAAEPESFQTLELLAAIVGRGGPGTEAAVARGLRRCAIPHGEYWVQAAMSIAEGDYEAIERDRAARLLYRLIAFLEHDHGGLVQAVRDVLRPLHVETLLSQFASFDPATRRRLGRVVRMVDSQAIESIEQALRHPLLDHRMHAITAAEAIAGVEDLADAFGDLARHDHREVKLRAIEALRHGSGDQSLQRLRELTSGPESAVRDAATEALHARSRQSSGRLAPPGPTSPANAPHQP